MIFNDIYGLNFVVEYHLEYRFPKRYYFAVAWDSYLRPGLDAGSERSTVIELSRGIHRTTVMATYLAFVGVGLAISALDQALRCYVLWGKALPCRMTSRWSVLYELAWCTCKVGQLSGYRSWCRQSRDCQSTFCEITAKFKC